MNKWGKRLLFVALAACLLCVGALMSHAAVDITGAFTDPNFKAVVYEEIGKTAPAPILDTDVAGVTALYAYWSDIESLAGLEYFIGLKSLYCGSNQLTQLPALPSGLTTLSCYSNQLTALPALPSGLTSLDCDSNQLTSLPTLPSSLTSLYCALNKLTALPTLPSGLKYLDCSNSVNGKGDITVMPNPGDYNKLTSLPSLPAGLISLNCSGLELLPQLAALPSTLEYFYCVNNLWTSLPTLPSGLRYLYCGGNKLTSLPTLPSGLYSLYCNNNLLTILPALPTSLKYLYCQNNKLTALNVTGLSPYWLNCSYNDMSSTADVIGFTETWGTYAYTFNPQNSTTPTVDKSALTAKLTQARAVQKGNYTDASWNALQSAITTAQAVADKAGATQPEVNAQVTALNNAIAALKNNTEPKGIFGTNPKWSGAWWHYLLFFFCFGFLWMWF